MSSNRKLSKRLRTQKTPASAKTIPATYGIADSNQANIEKENKERDRQAMENWKVFYHELMSATS